MVLLNYYHIIAATARCAKDDGLPTGFRKQDSYIYTLREASLAKTFHLFGRDPSLAYSLYLLVVFFRECRIFSFSFLIFILVTGA